MSRDFKILGLSGFPTGWGKGGAQFTPGEGGGGREGRAKLKGWDILVFGKRGGTFVLLVSISTFPHNTKQVVTVLLKMGAACEMFGER